MSFTLALLALWCALPVISNGFKLSSRKAPSYHINNVATKFTSNAPDHLENAMNRTMILSFETDDLSFSLDLELNTKLYGKHTQIYALDSNGVSQLQPKRYRAYLGSGIITDKTNNAETGDCSVNFYKDLRFHCVCTTQSDMYTIDLIHLQQREPSRNTGGILGSDSGHGMVLTRQSEVTDSNDDEHPLVAHKRRLLATTDQSQLVPFTSCFDGQYQFVHEVYIGIITDTSYNDVYDNDSDDVQTSIESMFNDASGANIIYYYQLNVQLTLGTLYIGESYTTSGYTYSPATISSSYDINTRLDQFSTWRNEFYDKNTGDTNGLWHLMTDHHSPPGTVGLAWVGVLCSYKSGTGVSNYINPATSQYGIGTWATFAHEVGHNFGGSHTFDVGGIMDYGDGTYNGAYQFHTNNRDEICTQITDSYTDNDYRSEWYKLIPLSNCWHEASTDPTPKPTSKPTSEDDEPTPKPTAKPTVDDTSDSSSDDSQYQWKWFDGYDGYSECDLECVTDTDTAYKTKDYSCYSVTSTTSGITTTYSYSQVDDSYCDAGTKPSETVACDTDDVPSCNNVCGDGITGTAETCDTKGTNGDCCSDDCLSWKTETVECFSVNPIVDAAFQDDTGAVYLFQDQYYAKYSNYKNYGSDKWSSNTVDDGYPKKISTSFPISSYSDGITAIAYSSNSEVYVFKGMDFVKIDLDSGEYSGYPQTFTDSWKVPTEITDCGSITAAWKYPSGDVFRVACDNVLAWADTQYQYNDISSAGTNEKITAMYNYPGSNSYVSFTTTSDETRRRRLGVPVGSESVFVGNVHSAGEIRRLQGSSSSKKKNKVKSILQGSNITSFDQIEDQSCNDQNCKSCSSEDKKVCYTCYDSYVLYGSVKCLHNNTLMYLDFDIDSSLTIDHYFVDGGYDTLKNDFDYTKTGLTGANSTAMLFDENTKLTLIPLDFEDSDEWVTEFRVSFRFKPYSISYNKFISIDDDKVSIAFMDNSEEYASFNESAQYIVLFTVGNNTYRCSFDDGLLINEWNTLEMEYSEDTFAIYTNGDRVKQAYSDWSGINVNLQFNEWYIGDDNGGGINGELDQVSFKMLDSSKSTQLYDNSDDGSSSSSSSGDTIVVTEKKYRTWMIVGICGIVVCVGLAVALCCMSKNYYAQKHVQGQAQANGYLQMGDQ